MMPYPLALLLGSVALFFGAEALVRGASSLASAARIPPLLIGLTLVAFGTSAPELAVSTSSALAGSGDVAIGNVIGSNIFNILFLLGLSALVAPLVVARALVRIDAPIMILISAATWWLAADGSLGRTEGAVLLLGSVVYTLSVIRRSRSEPVDPLTHRGAGADEDGRPTRVRPIHFVMVVGGLALLVLGARWFVDGAVSAARIFGVSELVIGLTVVAAGTSLPEVATSVTAVLRGERDIAVGNVIGSNIFNLLIVLGASALIAPSGLPVGRGVLTFDLPVMVAVATVALPLFFSGYVIARWEGAVLLVFYAAYVSWLGLDAVDHPALDEFRLAMLGFVLPLTALTIFVTVGSSVRMRRSEMDQRSTRT